LRTRHLRADEGGVALGNALTEREAVVAEVERLAKVGSWVWDVRTDEVVWSSEMFRILGQDPGTVKPTVDTFFAAIHPDDVEGVRARSQETSETGMTEPGSRCRALRPDGSIRHLTLIGAPIRDSAGNLVRLVGAALDVTEFVKKETELRRTAELLNQAQQIAGLGSWIWDIHDDTLEWSETLCSIVGVEVKSELRLSRFLERVHPDDQARVEQFRAQLRERQRPSALEFRIVRPDGVVRRVAMDARFDSEPPSQADRVVGTVLDVTKQRELEEQLRHSQKLEAVGTLAGGVAHDFNNYLVVIRGNLDLLGSALDGEANRELLDDISRATDRCATLTRQLLTFGRKHPTTPRLVQIEQIVTESTNMLRRLVGTHIELVVRAEPDLGAVLIDPSHVELVIMNLAVNARDAMPSGGTLLVEVGKRSVSAELASVRPGLSAGEYVVLRVSDTGSGIPDELKSRIFEPFFTTKRPGHGTGLGLATVYGVVQQSGGHIELHSHLGRGTNFTLFFPVHAAPVTRAAEEPAVANAARGETVLLVEDEPAVRRLTRRLLERGGYRVVEADNGLVALEVMESTPGIDLVLTDITMPKLDGIALARRLRALHPRLRLLLMSGFPDADALGVSQDEFGQPLLSKPFTLERLLERVRGALDKEP
jgi:PAS domain S-box-containing protein